MWILGLGFKVLFDWILKVTFLEEIWQPGFGGKVRFLPGNLMYFTLRCSGLGGKVKFFSGRDALYTAMKMLT